MSIYPAVRKIWYRQAGAVMIRLWNSLTDLYSWFITRSKFSSIIKEIKQIFFHFHTTIKLSLKERGWFQKFHGRSWETYHRGQRSRITMNIWFLFFKRRRHLSNILISQLGAVIRTAITPSSFFRLWVSDSSSLPVTARRLSTLNSLCLLPLFFFFCCRSCCCFCRWLRRS